MGNLPGFSVIFLGWFLLVFTANDESGPNEEEGAVKAGGVDKKCPFGRLHDDPT